MSEREEIEAAESARLSGHNPDSYVGRGQRCVSCGSLWPCDTSVALSLLDTADRRLVEVLEERDRGVWVSAWKHGPMDVFPDEESAKAWNVCRPRTLIWERIAEGAWRGYVTDEPDVTAVRVHHRSIRAALEPPQ